jgi:hypothetical protein
VNVILHPRYIKPNDHVDLWDLGPIRPTPPEAPKEVDEKLKGHELALAKIEYEDAFETYKDELRAFGRMREEFTKWHKTNGGPLKVDLWSTDAVHALATDPDRYKLELPKGTKPGAAQVEADRLAEMSEQDLAEARAKDPVFGKGNSR